MVGLRYYDQPGVTELFVMKDPNYVLMCFKSVETLEILHSKVGKRPRTSASVFLKSNNVELSGLYPMHTYAALSQVTVVCAGREVVSMVR